MKTDKASSEESKVALVIGDGSNLNVDEDFLFLCNDGLPSINKICSVLKKN